MSKLIKVLGEVTLISGGVCGLVNAVNSSYKEQQYNEGIKKISGAIFGATYGFPYGLAAGVTSIVTTPIWVPVVLYDKLINNKNN